MSPVFQALQHHPLARGSRYFHPKQRLPRRISLDDPALSIMTDLSEVPAFTVELSTPLDKSLEIMIKRGVRILLVCDTDCRIIGLLSSRDIHGIKPDRILAKAGGNRADLLVVDVMTLAPKLEVIRMENVRCAQVGDIITTLRQVDRQHLLVLDDDPETDQPMVRGIFSLSQIAVRLGLDIDPSRQPTTFADLEKTGLWPPSR
ncbi:MAG: CBS domain-containing protein [Candidatus Competibacteraceae bacterium]|nr:CBS domain-containing protein [Candidatus Competibacteraceae bacterium]